MESTINKTQNLVDKYDIRVIAIVFFLFGFLTAAGICLYTIEHYGN